MQKLCQTRLALNGWNHLSQSSGFVLQEELENVWLRPVHPSVGFTGNQHDSRGAISYCTKLRVSADFDSSMTNGIVSRNTRMGYATSAIGEFSDSILAARRSTNNKWAQ
jgi:hypothetical protein